MLQKQYGYFYRTRAESLPIRLRAILREPL